MVNGEWFYDYRQIKNGTKKVGRRFPPGLEQSQRGEISAAAIARRYSSLRNESSRY